MEFKQKRAIKLILAIVPAVLVITAFSLFAYHETNKSHAQTVATTTVPLSNPLHFDDTWWTWPSSTGYKNYSINITPEKDGSPDGYFFSSFFIFVNGGAPYNSKGVGFGYLGLQTEEDGGFTGKDNIFSIWGSTSAIGGQYRTKFTEGSSGWSVRNSYKWVVGQTYTLTVSYVGISKNLEVWDASLADVTTKKTSKIGELTVPKTFGLLRNQTSSFHERYSGPTSSCSDLIFSEVKFTDPLFNGKVGPLGHTNDQPDVKSCTNYGTVNITGGFESAIGGLPPQPPPVKKPGPSPTPPTPKPKPKPVKVSTKPKSTTTSSSPKPTTVTPVSTTPGTTPTITPVIKPSPAISQLEIHLENDANKPIADARVSLTSKVNAITNAAGNALLKSNLSSGEYTLTITKIGFKTYSKRIYVSSNQATAAPQQLAIKLAALKKSEWPVILAIGCIGAVLILIGFIASYFRKNPHRNRTPKSTESNPAPVSNANHYRDAVSWQKDLSTIAPLVKYPEMEDPNEHLPGASPTSNSKAVNQSGDAQSINEDPTPNPNPPDSRDHGGPNHG